MSSRSDKVLAVRALARSYANGIRWLIDEKSEVGFLVALAIAVATLQFAEPLLFGWLIQSLFDNSEGSGSWVGHGAVPGLITAWILIALFTVWANARLALRSDTLAHKHRLVAMTRFASAALRQSTLADPSMQSGRTAKVMLQGADSLFALWTGFLRGHVEVALSLAVLVPLTLAVNPYLGGLLLTLVIGFVSTAIVAVGRTRDTQYAVEDLHTDLVQRATDAVSNAELFDAYGRIQAEVDELNERASILLCAQLPVLGLWSFASVVSRSAATVSIALILLLGTWLKAHGEASIADIVAFVGFATLIAGKLDQLTSFVSQMLYQAPAIDQFLGVIHAAPRSNADAPCATEQVVARLTFEGVTASYASGKVAVRDLCFSVAEGEKIAFVGHTGAGKSTALAIAIGAIKPSKGRVLLDGCDISTISHEQLCARFSVVFQHSPLLARSVEENLRLGKPNASQVELDRALALSNAGFVHELEHGYQTVVGENGKTLSGGECQRLGIARALLRDAPILVLDEPFSSLDSETAAGVLSSLKAVASDKTVLIATHRLADLEAADVIFVFDQGHIVQRGKYKELCAVDGPFATVFGRHNCSK